MIKKRLYTLILIGILTAQCAASPLDNAIAGSFIEISSGEPKVMAGCFLPVISYRALNLDFGIIGDISSAQSTLGISCDTRKISEEWGLEYHLADNWVVGTYGHYQFDEKDWCYGFYVGSKFNLARSD